MSSTPIYYANGRVLRDGEGNIYNHLGQIFVRNNGTITYASGRTLRVEKHLGLFPWVLYYRNGDVLAEYREIYYPKPSGATATFKLFDGWSYFFDGQSQGIISQNWRAAQRIMHKNTVVAWNGREFRNPQNRVVNELSISEPIGQLGYLEIRAQNPSNPQMQSWIMFDLFGSSYIWPISFMHSPPQGISFTHLFDNFTIIIETGYWGELVMVGYPLKVGQLTYDCRYSTMHGMPVTGGRGFRGLKPLWYNSVPP